jgi:lysophospholipase L1-like esterase
MRIALLLVFATMLAAGTGDGEKKTSTAPCAQPQFLERWWLDFGQVAHYRAENQRLVAREEKDRVVFLGDSIIQSWDLGRSFPGHAYVNRGISAQTSAQMLVRFRQDVVALHPRAVVILAGTNDLAQNSAPETLEAMQSNMAAMVDMAHANGIRVVLATLPPFAVEEKGSTRLEARVPAHNQWLQEFCAGRKVTCADFYSSMADPAGRLRSDLSADGVHPNAAGYRVMTAQAEKALRSALAAD